jgi:nickel transport protein
MKRRVECLIIFAFCTILFIIAKPLPALSHKVNVFAYPEGDTIVTESYFNDGGPCKDSLIQVFDPEGKELLQGKTDENGVFSFRIPKKTDLKIVLTASLGHKNEYLFKASEMPDSLPATKAAKPPVPEKGMSHDEMKPDLKSEAPMSKTYIQENRNSKGKGKAPVNQQKEQKIQSEQGGEGGEKIEKTADKNREEALATPPYVGSNMEGISSSGIPQTVDMNQVRAAVRESVEEAIRPLMREMARKEATRISITEIIGGIGYIFGLMGLLLYFKKRGK